MRLRALRPTPRRNLQAVTPAWSWCRNAAQSDSERTSRDSNDVARARIHPIRGALGIELSVIVTMLRASRGGDGSSDACSRSERANGDAKNAGDRRARQARALPRRCCSSPRPAASVVPPDLHALVAQAHVEG